MDENLDNVLVVVKIARLSKFMDRLLDEKLRPLGLRRGQHALLLAVSDLNTPNMTALAKRLSVDKAAVTRSVIVCEQKGWLRTEFAPDSLKTKTVRLNKDGEALVCLIRDVLYGIEKDIESVLPRALYDALGAADL